MEQRVRAVEFRRNRGRAGGFKVHLAKPLGLALRRGLRSVLVFLSEQGRGHRDSGEGEDW